MKKKKIRFEEQRGVVLVTGAAGFTGATAVDYLLQFGYPVLATDLPGSDFSAIRKHRMFMRAHPKRCRDVTLEIIPADLTKPSHLKKLFANCNVQYIMHPAALYNMSASQKALHKVNVEGTRNLLSVAADNCGELLGVAIWSTFMVYAPSGLEAPITENTPPDPRNRYAESKLEQENAALEFERDGMKMVILRPALAYGPRGEYGIAKGIAPLVWSKYFPLLPIPADDVVSSYVHIDDVVGAAMHLIYALSLRPISGQIFNISDNTPLATKELMGMAARAMKVMEPTVLIPKEVMELLSNISPKSSELPILKLEREEFALLLQSFVLDNSKLASEGYHLKYPLSERGIEVTVDWLIRNNKLARFWYLTHPKWRKERVSIPQHEKCFADYYLLK